jgi:hypothetical protein
MLLALLFSCHEKSELSLICHAERQRSNWLPIDGYGVVLDASLPLSMTGASCFSSGMLCLTYSLYLK